MKLNLYVGVLLLAFSLLQCSSPQERSQATQTTTTEDSSTVMPLTLQSVDVHSFAKSKDAKIKHLHLDLQVDFAKKILHGTAAYRIEAQPEVKEIFFDTNGLKIKAVTDKDGNALNFSIGDADPILGAPLRVEFADASAEIHIAYESSPTAAALQWLTPQQTLGKKHPYLFTQSQAILARTWIPIQDSPGRTCLAQSLYV
jgi:leukotriene-A4 hydrolase